MLFVGVLFGGYTIMVYLEIPDIRSRGWVSQQEHYMYGPPICYWLFIR